MTIVEATKQRIEELCNERGLNFCRLATILVFPIQQSNQSYIVKVKIQALQRSRRSVTVLKSQ